MIYPFRKKFDQLFIDFQKSEVEIIQNNCENRFYSKRNDDDYVNSIYTPIRNIGIKATYSSAGIKTGYSVDYVNDNFAPLSSKDKEGKTLYDFVTSFFQTFNVITEIVDNKIYLARWDEIIVQPPTDWTKKLAAGVNTFKPSIDGYAQNNTIKLGTIYEGGDEYIGSRNIACSNKNLDAKSDLFTIDCHVPNYVQSFGGIVPDLSEKESFSTFQFLISAYESEGVKAQTTALIAIHFFDGVTTDVALKYMQMPSIYSIENEYQTLSKVLEYPEYREVSCWLTISDVVNLRFYAQYYFQQLGGCYFINKIAGFNPQKSLVATKLELIKVSDLTPLTPPDTDYYVDGVGDAFTDGEGDIFY